MRRAVFLDRDGTLNVEREYLYRTEDFLFIQGAVQAVRLLNESGLLVVVVSNQSGVARGYYSEEDVELLHRYADGLLRQAGAVIDAWYYCPHHPEGRGSYALPCRCRKPGTGMLVEASRRLDIDLSQSFMVGDKLIDIEAGLASGCCPILVRTGYGYREESGLAAGIEVCDDLLSAAVLIRKCVAV